MLENLSQESLGDGNVSPSEIKTYIEIGVLYGTAIISGLGTAWLAFKRKKCKEKLQKEKEITSIFKFYIKV